MLKHINTIFSKDAKTNNGKFNLWTIVIRHLSQQTDFKEKVNDSN